MSNENQALEKEKKAEEMKKVRSTELEKVDDSEASEVSIYARCSGGCSC